MLNSVAFSWKPALWLIVVVLSFCATPRSVADASSAMLSLEITDVSGAVIQDATVILRNIATNQEQRGITGKVELQPFPF
jgi:hypothetical protein